MNSFGVKFLLCVSLVPVIPFFSQSQPSRRVEKQINSNMRAHLQRLDQANETSSAAYITEQFQRVGLRPRGSENSWFRDLEVYEGRELSGDNFFSINGQALELFKEYFPLPFSGNAKLEATVITALAESGNPWFKDISDLLEEADQVQAMQSIQEKAAQAQKKGATALIVYSRSANGLVYDSMSRSVRLDIPVIFLQQHAFLQFCGDESAALDLKLATTLKDKKRIVRSIVAGADNGTGQTILTTSVNTHKESVAALLELARLSRQLTSNNSNLLFVVTSPEQLSDWQQSGAGGTDNIIHLDSIAAAHPNQDRHLVVWAGLQAIKNRLRL